MMRSKRTGFTLIELLVVIAIIAILAAILFPVFAKAREKARQTSCLSNEKQLGIGILQYVQDNGERYPGNRLTYNSVSYWFCGLAWGGQIYPYVKSTGVYKCPDDPTDQKAGLAGTTLYPVSYALNYNIPWNFPVPGFGGDNQTNMLAPASTVMLAEVISGWGDITDSDEGISVGNITVSPSTQGFYPIDTVNADKLHAADTPRTTAQNDCGALNGDPNAPGSGHNKQTGRHTDGSNFLMADGHAKWLRPAAVSPGPATGTLTFQPTTNQVDGSSCAGTQGFFSDGKTKPAATFCCW